MGFMMGSAAVLGVLGIGMIAWMHGLHMHLHGRRLGLLCALCRYWSVGLNELIAYSTLDVSEKTVIELIQ